MFINIDGTAVAIGVVLVLAALILLFPGRTGELVESARLTLGRALTPGTVTGVSG
ncbi:MULTISPECIES: hypothetical protein [Halorubrum]|uniref:hypothetical protein n=1 Tax=Halorubrum TaxID=56688 RepID=UPI000ADDDD5E|nr:MULTISPECIES: hypothetical protein [Halorubrum]